MRNILKFLIIGVFAIFVSCDNLNEIPEFSDSDAFVAFDNTTASLNEDGTILTIPVTLASINGMSATITYSIIDSTAKEGVNFTLVDQSKTLSFDAENRTQNIEVNIVNNPGVFTGDLKFLIQLSEDGVVMPSAENICIVTIKDIDHPLASILGSYSAAADSYFSSKGPFAWTISFDKDEEDVTVVWISNLEPYFASVGYIAPENNYFYGTVNEELTEITIPTGQAMGYETAELAGWTTADPDEGAAANNLIIEIQEDGAKLVMKTAYGVSVDDTQESFYNIMYGDLLLTKITK